MKLCKNLKGGLQEVADQLELRRVGPQHQAGSDSHLTGMAFFKIKEVLQCNKIIHEFYYTGKYFFIFKYIHTINFVLIMITNRLILSSHLRKLIQITIFYRYSLMTTSKIPVDIYMVWVRPSL